MLSMRSTTSSGVGTHTTSLPCWPTWGLKSFCWAYAAGAKANSAAASADRMPFGIARNISSSFYLSGNSVCGKSRTGDGGREDLLDILQRFGGVVGEARALAPLEGHVARMRPPLHAIHDIGETGAALGEVGRVDLRDIAQADDLGARPGAGDEGLHQAGGEREQGLARSRLAEQGHEVDFRIHEQIEREVLLAIARRDTPDVVLAVGVVAHGL